MKLIRGPTQTTLHSTPRVATIGKFDGVHLGHQVIVQRVIDHAKNTNAAATVIVFEPEPIDYFAPERAPAKITNWREKWSMLERTGIDGLVCLRFSAKLAAMSPESFIDKILVEHLDVKHLIVGDDFRFGHNRSGDFTTLKQYGAGRFTVENTESITQDYNRISSTLVRKHLAQGNLDGAQQLLGRTYSMSGKVVRGDQVGRTINFPTLNLAHKRTTLPLTGVFVVSVVGINDREYYGVANLGTRPTLSGMEQRLEVHLLHFDEECYGSRVEVKFLFKLRDEQKFSSLDQLKLAIQNDVNRARAWLEQNN